jgi:hypothetical protein
MARMGGYRPGAGRPKGSKSAKSAHTTPPKPSAHPRRTGVKGFITPPTNLPFDETPLGYMLRTMNDPDVDPVRRDRMAIAAAPFMHPRMYENRIPKKEALRAEAEKAADGIWADELGSGPQVAH